MMFLNMRKSISSVILAVLLLSLLPSAFATVAEDKVDLVAGLLDDKQFKPGESLYEGSWPNENLFTGSIVIGMVEAYHRTCDPVYKTVAELGGDYINEFHGYGGIPYYGYGDDAYAMAMLSSISADPQNNQWRTDLATFYELIKYSFAEPGGYDSTAGFISFYFHGTPPSNAVLYLAFHAMAADYVNAQDRGIWREAVHVFLSRVEDEPIGTPYFQEYPVMALGAAVWALASTGPMDSTYLAPVGSDHEARWDLVTLADLPGLLATHQLMNGSPNEGSFFWRFDHTDGGLDDEFTHGFTEDSIFGALGLDTAQKANELLDLTANIAAVKELLFGGVYPDGTVLGHLWEGPPDYAVPEMSVYEGEMLTALGKTVILGDTNMDDMIDFEDILIIAQNWLEECTCRRVDFDNSGIVDWADFAIVADKWLDGTD